MLLSPDVVVPRLRGSFGREYHYALETPTTQLMLAAAAGHGAVALAEHQTAGRGRRGRVWVDEPRAGLSFSIALRPPPPVGRWPELTFVAAEAVAGAIGNGTSIKDPNDVLLGGRKVAGILADARDDGRVVIGIGVNVGSVPWPDAAAAGGERLDLLLDILDRFEQGYDTWAAPLKGR